MEKRYFTIGMAGHIDHGKTSLTKALTSVDTDRLKEEKERQISIELGFAPLHIDDTMAISVIDVPGHERFIRQMIAGVAGIDLVILVVAADEGVMPQTKEHLEILSFLGVKRGIVAISKIEKVDQDFTELVREEISEQLVGTVFENAEMVLVDSISQVGIVELKNTIKNQLQQLEARNSSGSFRLPIDQVFTVKGQGTVVRGTVYEGSVQDGDHLTILPSLIETKARQLQIHQQSTNSANAGQRVAVNLSGINTNDVKRGDVLVSSKHYVVTETIDVTIKFVSDLDHVVKQRGLIKCHIGTSEVLGKIVFFDRNEVEGETEEVLCQLRLEEPIVTKRGDRLIIRRPSPTETIAGGWVIDPHGKKYRFGEKTIEMLTQKREGTPLDRILDAFHQHKELLKAELMKVTSLDEYTIAELLNEEKFIKLRAGFYTHDSIINELRKKVISLIEEYHTNNPLRLGMNKAEINQELSRTYPKNVVEHTLDLMLEDKTVKKEGQFISAVNFKPTFPKQWAKRMEQLILSIEEDQLHVKPWDEYTSLVGLPEKEAGELKWFLLTTNQVYQLDDKLVVNGAVIWNAINRLKEHTETGFELKDAKEILSVSRKYLVPLLELFDTLRVTKREDNKRFWVTT